MAILSPPLPHEAPAKLANRYRTHLQTAVSNSAAPYGYTLTVWTSGAIITHAQGIPTGLEAVLFLGGAVAGFAAVGTGAHGSVSGLLHPPRSPRVRLWGGFHLPSVGLAIAGAAVVSALVQSSLAWPLVGFVITAIYLSVIAAQFTIADSTRQASGEDDEGERPDAGSAPGSGEVPGTADRPGTTDGG